MTKQVTKPVLTIKHPHHDTTFSVWVLNPGQFCKLSEASCHEFQARKTGSLVYEVKDIHGHNATEYNLWEASVWSWIQEHMQNGFNLLPA